MFRVVVKGVDFGVSRYSPRTPVLSLAVCVTLGKFPSPLQAAAFPIANLG